MISISHFTGMVPRLAPASLPDGGSQIAHNVVAASGALTRLNATGPFTSSHDGDGNLVAGIPESELPTIVQPLAPTFHEYTWLCRPGEGQWLNIWLCSFVQVIDASGGRTTYIHHAVPLTWDYRHTETGLVIRAWTAFLSPASFAAGGPYYFRGPRFMFALTPNPGAYGGPQVYQNLPGLVLPGSPVFSRNTVPLIDLAGNVYGEFQVVDYEGPVWDEDFMVTDYPTYTYYFGPLFECTFKVDLGFARPKREHRFYVASNVDAEDREGPPSELSQEFVVLPGQRLTLNTPHEEPKVRLYRSQSGIDEDFALVEEGTWTSYADAPHPVQNISIPPFGNWARALGRTLESEIQSGDLDTFREGSVIHPGGWGATLVGHTLWRSDRYRLHAWPDENTTVFLDEAGERAIVIVGDTILVFIGNRVRAFSGSDPANQAEFLVSDTTPLLNILGLCWRGNVVYWPTNIGLAACSGNRADIVTKALCQPEQWQDLNPADMSAQTDGNAIYLDATFTAEAPPSDGVHRRLEVRLLGSVLGTDAPATGIGVRIDLDEGAGALTTYGSLTGGRQTWRSKQFVSPFDVTYDFVRIGCDGPSTVTARVDGVDQAAVNVPDDGPFPVAWPHGRYWEWTVIWESGTLASFEAFDRTVIPGQDVLTFTPENTPAFRAIRVSWPEPQTIAAVALSCQDAAAVAMRIYADAETEPYYETTISTARSVPIPIADMRRVLVHRVELDTEARIDQFVVAREAQSPVQNDIQEARTGVIFPSDIKEYVWAAPTQMRSVRIGCEVPAVAELYYDGSVEVSKEVEIGGPWEYRVASGSLTSLRVRVVDALGDPVEVKSLIVATSAPQEAPVDGVHLAGGAAYRRLVLRFLARAPYSAVSIVADAYPLYLDIRSEWLDEDHDDPDYTVTISGPGVFALPWQVERSVNLWEFDIRDWASDLRTRVHAYHLWPKRGVPMQGHLSLGNPGGAAPWLTGRFDWQEETYWPSFKVETLDGESVWLWLWADGQAQDVIECPAGLEQYLGSALLHGRSLECRFTLDENGHIPADDVVTSFEVYAARPEPVGDAVTISGHPWLWREFQFPHAGLFRCAQLVLRETYTSTPVRISVNNGLVPLEVAPPDTSPDTAFALPEMARAARWTVGIENATAVKSLILWPEQTQKVQGGIEAHAVPGPPDWLRTLWEFDAPTGLNVIKVEADSYPIVALAEINGAGYTHTVASGDWGLTAWYGADGTVWDLYANTLRLRFETAAGLPADSLVRCVRLMQGIEVPVPVEGIVSLSGLPNWQGIRLRSVAPVGWAGVLVDADAAATVTIVGGAHTATASASAQDADWHRLLAAGETEDEAIETPTYEPVWLLSVTCAARVRSVTLLAWQPVEIEGVVTANGGPGVPEWYRSRYRSVEPNVPRSVRVNGATGVNIYAGTTKVPLSEAVGEQRIDRRYEIGPASAGFVEMVLDFTVPGQLKECVVACEEFLKVGATGFALREADSAPGRPWRNKVFEFNEPGVFSAVRARGASSVCLRAYGATSWTTVPLDGDPTILPALAGQKQWEVDPVHADVLREFELFTRVMESVKDGLVVIRHSGDPFCWLDKRVLVARPIAFSCGRVIASGAVTLRVMDGMRNVLYTMWFSGSSKAERLHKIDARRDWAFDVVPASATTVIEELALATNMEVLRKV